MAGLVALVALAGCREDEQDQPLSYDKGVYQGKADDALPEGTSDVLRQRAQHQSYN